MLGTAGLCFLGTMGILWWLPDVTAHGTARTLATMAAVFFAMMFVLLDGGFMALRFGAARGMGGAACVCLAVAQGVVRTLSVLLLLGMVTAAVLFAGRWSYPRGTAVLLFCVAVMFAGYVAVFRLEKWLRDA